LPLAKAERSLRSSPISRAGREILGHLLTRGRRGIGCLDILNNVIALRPKTRKGDPAELCEAPPRRTGVAKAGAAPSSAALHDDAVIGPERRAEGNVHCVGCGKTIGRRRSPSPSGWRF
jgi:hypothetical protein